MVNPLARVAMKNTIEKEKKNLVIKSDAKTLSDFAKVKKQEDTTKSNNSYTYNKNSYAYNSYNMDKTKSNIITKPDEKISSLIKDVIGGEVKIKGNNSIDTAITLEEAAEKIKQ